MVGVSAGLCGNHSQESLLFLRQSILEGSPHCKGEEGVIRKVLCMMKVNKCVVFYSWWKVLSRVISGSLMELILIANQCFCYIYL